MLPTVGTSGLSASTALRTLLCDRLAATGRSWLRRWRRLGGRRDGTCRPGAAQRRWFAHAARLVASNILECDWNLRASKEAASVAVVFRARPRQIDDLFRVRAVLRFVGRRH